MLFTGRKLAALAAAFSTSHVSLAASTRGHGHDGRYHHDHKPGYGKMDLSNEMGAMDEYHSPSPSADADQGDHDHEHEHHHRNSFLQEESDREDVDFDPHKFEHEIGEGESGSSVMHVRKGGNENEQAEKEAEHINHAHDHHAHHGPRGHHNHGDSPGQHEATLMDGRANRGNLRHDNSFLADNGDAEVLQVPGAGSENRGFVHAVSSFLSGLLTGATPMLDTGFLQGKQPRLRGSVKRSKRAFMLA